MRRLPFKFANGSWDIARLGDLTSKIGSGATPLGGEKVYLKDRVNFALIRSQAVHDRFLDLEAISFISDEDAQRLSSAEVKSGDVLLNITGDGTTFGRAALAPFEALPACVNQHVCIIRPNTERLNAKFLLSYLTHPDTKHYIESFNAGGSRRAITKGHIESFLVPLPPIQQQEAIGSLLFSIDRKIEVSRQTQITLEKIGSELFRDWFVNFGPTHRKVDGGAPYLDESFWNLFPDRFVAAGIPAGWSIEPLDNIAKFLNGLAMQKFPAEGQESLPVIKIAELRQGVTHKSDRASLNVPAEYLVDTGDVLFSWSGSLTHLLWRGGQGALNQHLFKVTSESFPKWFFYYWIAEHMPDFQAIAASKATTMGHIQRHHLHQALTVVPTPDVLSAADKILNPLFDEAVKISTGAATLLRLRNLLLPALLSGVLGVKDAEQFIQGSL